MLIDVPKHLVADAARALQMRANFIETGNACLGRNDAINQRRLELCRRLDGDQLELVGGLRRLADFLVSEEQKRRISPPPARKGKE